MYVVDAEGVIYTTSETVSVTLGLTVVIVPARTVADVGEAVSFAGFVTGESGTVSYLWSFGDGTAPTTASSPSHVFAGPGSDTVDLTVSDGTGAYASNATVLTLNPPLGGDASASPTPGVVGAAVSFNATARGGTAPYSFDWVFGDRNTGVGASAPHAYATSGAFTATVWINDSAGVGVVRQVSVTVGADGPGPGSGDTGALPGWGPFLVLGGIVVALVVVFLASRLRRRGSETESGAEIDPGAAR